MHVLARLTSHVFAIRILKCRMPTKNHTHTLNMMSAMDMVATAITEQGTTTMARVMIHMQYLRMTITVPTVTMTTVMTIPLTNF